MWFCPLYVFDGMKRGRRRPNCVEDCISDNSPVQDTQGEYPSCLPSLTPLSPSPPARSKGSVCINITCRVILQPRACVHYLSIRGAAGGGGGEGKQCSSSIGPFRSLFLAAIGRERRASLADWFARLRFTPPHWSNGNHPCLQARRY